MLYGKNMLNLKFLSPMNFLYKKVGGGADSIDHPPPA